MIYLRLSKEDDARLTKAAERSGKSKAAFARDAIEIQLPVLEQEVLKTAENIENGIPNRS
jgi:predicted DNA-binding protein